MEADGVAEPVSLAKSSDDGELVSIGRAISRSDYEGARSQSSRPSELAPIEIRAGAANSFPFKKVPESVTAATAIRPMYDLAAHVGTILRLKVPQGLPLAVELPRFGYLRLPGVLGETDRNGPSF